jgi:dTDP-4-dehydrorhamnose reductase
VQKLLVTGASGLLGNKIAKIANNTYEVIPTYNTTALHSNSVKLDITNLNAVSNVFSKLEPNIVIHTASETNVDKCEIEKEHAWKTNAEGTRNIAEACQKVNAKLVCVSTDYVFNGEKGLYEEEDKPDPVNYYGLTKLEGEKQVIKHCQNHAILRTSVLYGWHPRKLNFTTWIINQLRQGKQVTVVDDHYNTPTWAGSLAEMAIEIADKDLQGLYHTSGRERISRYEFAKQIARIFNLDANLVKPVKMSQLTAWIAKRPKDSSLSTGKIQKQLKTKPLNITEGLNKMSEEMEA